MVHPQYKQYKYRIRIICRGWTGNFDRELIAYTLGCLDDMQMGADCIAQKELNAFWHEEYGMDPPEEQSVLYDPAFIQKTGYNILTDYLAETYQDVDDWKQNTFYNVKRLTEETSELWIQLHKPFPENIMNTFLERTKRFFKNHICQYMKDDDNLLSILMEDQCGKTTTLLS